jgi:hypothetical protein
MSHEPKLPGQRPSRGRIRPRLDELAIQSKNRRTNFGAGVVMYRFLEGTADQYMTRQVTTVTRETTMRELEALFEKDDFNSFP